MGDRIPMCSAANGSGTRCRRIVAPDSDYCWQHAGHAKTGAGSGGHVMVQLSPAAFAIVDRLVATGLYGESRRACVEALVLQALREEKRRG